MDPVGDWGRASQEGETLPPSGLTRALDIGSVAIAIIHREALGKQHFSMPKLCFRVAEDSRFVPALRSMIRTHDSICIRASTRTRIPIRISIRNPRFVSGYRFSDTV